MDTLHTLPTELSMSGWQLATDGKSIHKPFKFKSFRAAMAFMLQVSYEAEAIDHHPDWMNVYNRIDVKLTTHDIGGLSALDFKLAAFMDKVAS